MKTLIALLALTLLSTSAQSAEVDKVKLCATYSNGAEVIMRKRQEGVDMVVMLSLLEDNVAKEALTELIISAYNKSQFSTEEYVNRSIRQFKNQAMLTCLKVMK